MTEPELHSPHYFLDYDFGSENESGVLSSSDDKSLESTSSALQDILSEFRDVCNLLFHGDGTVPTDFMSLNQDTFRKISRFWTLILSTIDSSTDQVKHAKREFYQTLQVYVSIDNIAAFFDDNPAHVGGIDGCSACLGMSWNRFNDAKPARQGGRHVSRALSLFQIRHAAHRGCPTCLVLFKGFCYFCRAQIRRSRTSTSRLLDFAMSTAEIWLSHGWVPYVTFRYHVETRILWDAVKVAFYPIGKKAITSPKRPC